MTEMDEEEDDCAFDRTNMAGGKAAGDSNESVNSEVWEDVVLALLPEDYLQALTLCAVRQQVEEGQEEQENGGKGGVHVNDADDILVQHSRGAVADDATAFVSVASKTDFASFWKHLPAIMKIENKKKETFEGEEEKEEKKGEEKAESPTDLIVLRPPDSPNKKTAISGDNPKEMVPRTISRDDEKSVISLLSFEQLKLLDDRSLTGNRAATRSTDENSVESLLSLHRMAMEDGSIHSVAKSVAGAIQSGDEVSVDSLLSFYRMHQDDFSSVGDRSVARSATRSTAMSVAKSTARSTAQSTARSVRSATTLQKFYRMLEDDGSATLETFGRSVARSTRSMARTARSFAASTGADDETSVASFVSALTGDDLSLDFDTAFVPLRAFNNSFFSTIQEYPSDEEKSDDEEEDEEDPLFVREIEDDDKKHKSMDKSREHVEEDHFCSIDSMLDAWELPRSSVLCNSATQSCLPPPPKDLLPEALIPSEATFEKVRSIISV